MVLSNQYRYYLGNADEGTMTRATGKDLVMVAGSEWSLGRRGRLRRVEGRAQEGLWGSGAPRVALAWTVPSQSQCQGLIQRLMIWTLFSCASYLLFVPWTHSSLSFSSGQLTSTAYSTRPCCLSCSWVQPMRWQEVGGWEEKEFRVLLHWSSLRW